MQFSTLIQNFKTSGKFDLSAYHDALGTEQFINHTKNSVPAIPEEYYRDFCLELSRTIEEKEIFKNKNAWQLSYIVDEHLFTSDVAIQNLKQLAFSLSDSWATYIYARNCFISGKISEGAEIIAHSFSRGIVDKKLNSALYTIPFFKGNLLHYQENSLFLETNDSFYANVDARMSFIARNFDQVIKIASKTNDVSPYTKNLAARSAFNNQHIKNTPIQNLPILVIGDKNKKIRGVFYAFLRIAPNSIWNIPS
ncbi:hypothetical protein [Acidocella aromatica]|uniref:Uncharacterized protein n=1 Tax=Acidocella aromatica TaxID=1303579 RepID=A0A840VMC5_9PROT|nr:hypothetical protein [Acidocella aromatica]MBB5372751.1 hypothetical protein [Acidocella aromatica]